MKKIHGWYIKHIKPLGIKDCPSCGETELMRCESSDWTKINIKCKKNSNNMFHIKCLGCGFRSGKFNSKEESIVAWNRRVTPENG